MNGGMLRCISLLNQLSKYFLVTIITHQKKELFAQAFDEYPFLKNCTVISTGSFSLRKDIFSVLPLRYQKALRYRYWNRSLFNSSEDHFLMIYPVLKDFLNKNKVDYAIMEALFIVGSTAKVVRRYQPKAQIIYNVDSQLAQTAFENGKISEKGLRLIQKEESSLADSVNKIFACSDIDLAELRRLNDNKIDGFVIPNGVKINAAFLEKKQHSQKNNKILFCGSMDYFPNQEGLTWFCKEVFPLIINENPDIQLMVVGKGDPGEELLVLLKHPSIIFYGMVDRVDDYYRKAAVAVVPLLSGSGTRLKLLEAMGSNTATVSTTAGAEGIHYTNKKNILIADDKVSFARAVVELINDERLANSIAEAAFHFVKENYDWNIIGQKLETCLNSI